MNSLKHVEFHAAVNLGNWCIWLVLLWKNKAGLFLHSGWNCVTVSGFADTL